MRKRSWAVWIAGSIFVVLGLMALFFRGWNRNAPWAAIKTIERLNPGTNLPAAEAGAAELPPWVPQYPGARSQTVGFIDTRGTGGVFEVTIGDPAGKVFEFYRRRLAAAGFGVRITPNGNGAPGGYLEAASPDRRRSINVAVGEEEHLTKAMLQIYEAPEIRKTPAGSTSTAPPRR